MVSIIFLYFFKKLSFRELMRLFDDKRKNSVSSPGRLKKIIGERNNQFAENTQQVFLK